MARRRSELQFVLLALALLIGFALVGGQIVGTARVLVGLGLVLLPMVAMRARGPLRSLRGRWHQSKMAASIGEGDVEAAQARWQQSLRPIYELQQQTIMLRYQDAVILVLREEWQAALDSVETLQATGVSAVLVKSLRATCFAHLGRDAEAFTLASETLAANEVPGLRPALQTTIALALVHQSHPERALPRLDEVAEAASTPILRASCSFVRGDALRALGREDEARAAYERTAALAPLSRYAVRARQRLALVPPGAHR
jgi:predicted negative regulator of RcsB-dependent stress response